MLDGRGKHRDREQAGQAGGRVVHTRRDAELVGRDRTEHGRGERRDGDRQSEPEHDRRPGSTVVTSNDRPDATRVNNSMPSATTIGPTVIGMRGPMRCASAPIRDDSSSIMIVTGSERRAGFERGVAERDLELVARHEHRRAERAVHRERRAVRATELAANGTAASGSIGCALRAFHDDERDDRHDRR